MKTHVGNENETGNNQLSQNRSQQVEPVPEVVVKVGPVPVPADGTRAELAAVVLGVHVVQEAVLIVQHQVAEGAAEVGAGSVFSHLQMGHGLQLQWKRPPLLQPHSRMRV